MTEKNYNISLLLDFYGDILSPAQSSALDLYYNEDYSLAEIAEQAKITRQGVRDNIKRGEELLLRYEEKLGLADRFARMKVDIVQLHGMLTALKEQNPQSGGDIDRIIEKTEILLSY